MSVTRVRRHKVSNYFYCRVRPERLLYDDADNYDMLI